MTVVASRPVRASARAVYDFLERLPNHALITGGGLRLEGVAADGRGARISMRGPLGLRRTARTRVIVRRGPRAFGGTARVGRHTVAYVHWAIDAAGPDASLVTLSATVLRTGTLDRLLLAIGGRPWLARSFARAIVLLGVAVEGTPGAEECARLAG
jgi:hypothetical protein